MGYSFDASESFLEVISKLKIRDPQAYEKMKKKMQGFQKKILSLEC